MAEWLFEEGIGERRAALIDGERLVCMKLERDEDGAQPGSIWPARLISARERTAVLNNGEPIFLKGTLEGCSDGCAISIAIERAAIGERDLVKKAVGRWTSEAPCPAPSLIERIRSTGFPVHMLRVNDAADRLSEAGWGDAIEQAQSGILPFAGGVLRIALTPAMTVIDVDGQIDDATLPIAGAVAAANAIALFGLAGSIAIDLPTGAERKVRAAAAEAFDAAWPAFLPSPIRMAVNAFGLLHVVRKRERPSILERMQFAPVESAALALLRQAERSKGTGALTLSANPAVIGWMEERAALTDELARRTGRPVRLQAEPRLRMDAGHAQ